MLACLFGFTGASHSILYEKLSLSCVQKGLTALDLARQRGRSAIADSLTAQDLVDDGDDDDDGVDDADRARNY